MYTYQTTFGHWFQLLPSIYHQPNLVHGFLTPLLRGVLGIFGKLFILTEMLYFSVWKKDWKFSCVHAYQTFFSHAFEVLPFKFHQPNLVHGFLRPLPQFWILTKISYFWVCNKYSEKLSLKLSKRDIPVLYLWICSYYMFPAIYTSFRRMQKHWNPIQKASG